MSGVLIVDCKASKDIVVRLDFRHDTLPKTILLGTLEGGGRRGTLHPNSGQHQGMAEPVNVVHAVHRRRQKPMGSHRSRRVCSTSITLGRYGNTVNYVAKKADGIELLIGTC